MARYEWVSCSKKEFGPNGDMRHLIQVGSINTVCGFTATHASIWRRDRKKPKCEQCPKVIATYRNVVVDRGCLGCGHDHDRRSAGACWEADCLKSCRACKRERKRSANQP